MRPINKNSSARDRSGIGRLVWRWRRVGRYIPRDEGTAKPPSPPCSSYNDTARRVPSMVFADSAELVSNWRGAIKCRHERARPGNCLISWVRAPIRQPDVTVRRVAARNTVTFNVKWLSKEKPGYISCARAYARVRLGLCKTWTDRLTDIHVALSLEWISVEVERPSPPRHERLRHLHPPPFPPLPRAAAGRDPNCPDSDSIRVYIGNGYALLVRLIAISRMFLTWLLMAARTDDARRSSCPRECTAL